MLVLSRYRGEKITIGDEITITILDISNGKVRIGFDAPKHIKIHRQEIYDTIMRARTTSDSKENDINTTGTNIDHSTQPIQ